MIQIGFVNTLNITTTQRIPIQGNTFHAQLPRAHQIWKLWKISGPAFDKDYEKMLFMEN
jgi:hypothetical protein